MPTTPSHPSAVRHPVVAVRRRQVLPAWVRTIDRAAAHRVRNRRTHPLVDRGYARLSHSANRSVLWLSIAAGLFVLGNRRAAVRGSASIVVASALANLVGKRVFGGDRPLLKDIPVGRRLKRHPTSASFPSGHSASAAAFATGVALESPRAGAAVAPAALAVAYSRLHTGAHWLSDVIGGFAIGAGVALVGRWLVPSPQPPAPESAPRGGTPTALPASADGAGVFIVVNPASGGTLGPDPATVLERALPAARLHRSAEGEDLAAIVRAALTGEDPPRVIGVCGGDGTVATVAGVAQAADVPLLVLPGGTFNHFARTAGLESVQHGIDALAAGTGLRVDVGTLSRGDREPVTVLNTVSLGVYPDFVAEREKLEPRFGKWLGGVVAAGRVLRTVDPVTVLLNGRRVRVWSLYVGVSRNSPATVAPLQRLRLGGNVLDVRILHAGRRDGAALSLAFGRRTSRILRWLLPGSSVIERFVTDAVTLEVPAGEGSPAVFAHDGEVEHAAVEVAHRFTVRVAPRALSVYSPLGADRPEPDRPL
ncbi:MULTISPECIES: phosphatase PAP2 family protein [unclassified Diaminobutyricimonas]|uniref:bifunctional phosphatase PAP2/diacylglycerol kinase family protein n=1 Tax=unclassified Diaminobutyricimonas TaxID=2643261 RepID=UPI0012F4791D|nr:MULTISPECIES: phosphatase PAP2 family protein [unclassified Diaminobutyricimonas]